MKHLIASACAAAALLTAVPTQAADNWTEIASTPRKKVLLQRESINGPLEVHDIDLARRSDWKAVGGPTTVSGIVFKRVCALAR